jgi:cytochrome P450
MEKRSAIYSSRAYTPFASGILSSDSRMLLMPYGERWRLLRKIMHTVMNKQNMPTFAPFQDVESRHLLWDYLKYPDLWYSANQRYANSVIMSVVFGKRMQLADPDTKELFDTSTALILALQPGASLVDIFPWLDKLPKPLQWWRKRGEYWNKKTVS